MKHTPVAIGLQLCRDYIVEEGSRNVTLVKCFHQIQSASFPLKIHPLALAARLTDGQGELQLSVVVCQLATMKEAIVKAVKVQLNDRLANYWFLARASKVTLPVEGLYQFVLLSDGELVGQCTLEALILED